MAKTLKTLKTLRILNVCHTGANNKYHQKVLQFLYLNYDDIDITEINLGTYSELKIQNVYDVLVYQTFPDQNVPGKFNPNLVEQTDRLFHEFQGLKILADTHDNGEVDAYERFKDPSIPRIKCFPSNRYLDRHKNIAMLSTINIGDTGSIIYPDRHKRTIKISCKFSDRPYFHGIRRSIIMQLLGFPDVNRTWVDGRRAYLEDMRRTLIAVGAPGWGQYSATHQLALRTGALLFTHEAFSDIQYLPWKDLKDGTHYVSFNLFNFKYKLQWLLDHPDKIEWIRHNGKMAFNNGYSIERSAKQLYNWIMRQLL